MYTSPDDVTRRDGMATVAFRIQGGRVRSEFRREEPNPEMTRERTS